MPLRLLSVVTALLLAADAPAQEVDTGKLRALVRLPGISTTFGIGFSSERGFTLAGETFDDAAEIAALEKAMCGDRHDAARFLRLSQLYDEDKKSDPAAAKAVELYAQQARAEPRNASLAMHLGQALAAQGKEAEAEPWLRQATQLSPGDGAGWHSLGDFLFSRALGTLLLGRERRKGLDSIAALLQVASGTLPRKNIQASLKVIREAATCFERSVTAAPRRPGPYLMRGFSRGVVVLLEEFGRAAPGKEEPARATLLRVLKRLGDARIVQDIQKVAELDPTSPRARAVAGVCEVGAVVCALLLSQKEGQAIPDEAAKACQAQVLRIIDQTVEHLRGLTDHPEPRIAGDACYLAGLIVLLTEEMLHKGNANRDKTRQVEQWLRRSVALVPGNQSAWDCLGGALLDQEKYKELRAVCEARLRVADTAHNRRWAARAYQELGQLDLAEKALRAGVRLDEKDAATLVSLAAVLVKRGDRPALAEAREWLDRAEGLLGTDEQSLVDEVTVLRAVDAALSGNPAAAREKLQAVVERHKDHRTAAKLLQALGD